MSYGSLFALAFVLGGGVNYDDLWDINPDPPKPEFARVVLYFGSQGCSACDYWKNYQLPKLQQNPAIKIGTKDEHNLRIFSYQNPNHRDLYREWEIRRFPTFVFLDDMDKEKYTVKSKRIGSVPADEIEPFLN